MNQRNLFYLLLLGLLSRLPLRFLQFLGRMIGSLAWFMPHITPFFTTERNLKLCFPDHEESWYRKTTVRCLQSMAMTYLEFAKCWGMPPEYSIGLIREVHGEEIFHKALAKGRGTIALVPHYGNWEFMNAWTNQYVHTTIMYKPSKEPGIDHFIRKARSRLKADLVATDESGVRSLMKALKRNGFVAILPDHVPQPKGGVWVPFFGIETLSTVLASRLWQKTHASVIVMYTRRRPQGDGFNLYFEEPDEYFYSEDLPTSVTGMNRTVEQVIRADPEAYQWAYKRFKECTHLRDAYDRNRMPTFLKPHPAEQHFRPPKT